MAKRTPKNLILLWAQVHETGQHLGFLCFHSLRTAVLFLDSIDRKELQETFSCLKRYFNQSERRVWFALPARTATRIINRGEGGKWLSSPPPTKKEKKLIAIESIKQRKVQWQQRSREMAKLFWLFKTFKELSPFVKFFILEFCIKIQIFKCQKNISILKYIFRHSLWPHLCHIVIVLLG